MLSAAMGMAGDGQAATGWLGNCCVSSNAARSLGGDMHRLCEVLRLGCLDVALLPSPCERERP